MPSGLRSTGRLPSGSLAWWPSFRERHHDGLENGRRPSIRFLDLIASSLPPSGYPIKIARVDEDGAGKGHLIRPDDEWLRLDHGMPGWSAQSEAVHGISLAMLLVEGEPVEAVACPDGGTP